MRDTQRFIFSLLIGLIVLLPQAQAQFVNFEETWQEFLANEKTSNISKLTKPSKEDKIDFAKYNLMYANTYFCSGKITSAQNRMEDIKKIGEENYKTITGYKEKHDDLVIKIKAYFEVEKLWNRFLKSRDVSLEELEAANDAKRVCEKGTLAKYFYMTAHHHFCKGDLAAAKENFENRVLKLAERTTLKVADVQGLEPEVKKMKSFFQGLKKLGPAWKEYMSSGVSPGFDAALPVLECYSIPNMKALVLQAAVDPCENGKEKLEIIKKLEAANDHPVEGDLKEKIAWLKETVGKSTGDLASLNEAWKEFVPNDTLSRDYNYGYEYCRKEDVIKAYVMDGMMMTCEKGKEMMSNIEQIMEEDAPKLDMVTQSKVAKLQARLTQYDEESIQLRDLWTEFIANEDTILKEFQLVNFYCDHIDQVKSWTIKGHFDPCDQGQQFLDKIDALQKSEQLTFDEELDCRVLRLRGKVYQCRYWELVLQARKETHEERERFGPASAKIMEKDLNSDQLPCNTTVAYEPLGNIGIQYIISTFLCQEIDLAKMGDPEYYKKIATWVDTEVLQKYCEVDLHCKEDFNIYLEGHTDGHAFKGARYKSSLDIPEGTAYTYYSGIEAEDKTTDREITTSLRSNVELGIARAWTVKHQLDFMQVPISIGAYEHPENEKGGEYRRVEIELNITNLLLDFYGKRLNELIEASGIGERPGGC